MKEEIIEFSNFPDVNFNFPTNSSSNSQALPFAALLDGSESVVVQGLMERELDGKLYKYVGVSGTDKFTNCSNWNFRIRDGVKKIDDYINMLQGTNVYGNHWLGLTSEYKPFNI